jgi:hypothetical protein
METDTDIVAEATRDQLLAAYSTAVRGRTARIASALASKGAEDVLNAWLD